MAVTTLDPQTLSRLTALFNSDAESPHQSLLRYWEKAAAIRELRLTLSLAEVEEFTNMGRRKIGLMRAVCETITAAERDRYVQIIAAKNHYLSIKVIEELARYPQEVRTIAIKEYASKKMTLKPIYVYMKCFTPTPARSRKKNESSR
jgi:hypothetical protein